MRRAMFITFLIALGTMPARAWIHGSASVPTFKDWKEALEQLPCDAFAHDGKDLKIPAKIIVDGKDYSDYVIRKPEEIELVDRRCFHH